MAHKPAEGGGRTPLTVLLKDMERELAVLNQRIGAFDDEITALAKSDPTIRRLTAIPGIGPMIASALVAAVGDGATFKKGRDLSA